MCRIQRERGGEGEREGEREGVREAERETERQRDRETETERELITRISGMNLLTEEVPLLTSANIIA